ncbi:MAG: hypothetical protein OXH59_08295 [Rhodospirillaceae bacterium]|nr:hypothetical protein [Rhodospirillaceae bacterium]
MAVFDVRLRGVDQVVRLERELLNLRTEAPEAALQAVRNYARGRGLRILRTDTPRRSGRLRSRWTVRPTPNGVTIENRSPYAGAQLFGRRFGRNVKTRQAYAAVFRGAKAVAADTMEKTTADKLGGRVTR